MGPLWTATVVVYASLAPLVLAVVVVGMAR